MMSQGPSYACHCNGLTNDKVPFARSLWTSEPIQQNFNRVQARTEAFKT